MSLTKTSFSMITGAPVNVLDFGVTGNGYTDDSTAFQSAINAAIASTGSLFVPAGNYLIGTSLSFNQSGSSTAGLKIFGGSANSVGSKSLMIQANINVPVFQIDAINVTLSNLSFTVFAGFSANSNGNITVTAVGTNSLTVSANPNANVWQTTTALTATNGTTTYGTSGSTYSTAIQFQASTNTYGGSFYASSYTVNGNGTVTFNNVHGANGTTDSILTSSLIGGGIIFTSLANSINTSLLTNANAGIIYCSVNENQFYNNLWFYQATRCFNLGSNTHTNLGFMHNILSDGAINFIYSQAGITSLAISDSQFYGTNLVFYSPYSSLSSIQMTNCQLIIGEFIQANNNITNCNFTGNNFNGLNGDGYSTGLINIGGTITDTTIVGNTFGRSGNGSTIAALGFNNVVFVGNSIQSNGEGGSNPFIYLTSTLTNSTLSNNNFASEFSSSGNRLGFVNSPTISNNILGPEFILNTTSNYIYGWVAATFTNSWAQVSGTPTVSYFKDQNGIVHLKGSASGGTASSSIFTLPSGFAPTVTNLRFPSVNSGTVAYITITNSGTVTSSNSGNTYVSLDGISFSTY